MFWRGGECKCLCGVRDVRNLIQQLTNLRDGGDPVKDARSKALRWAKNAEKLRAASRIRTKPVVKLKAPKSKPEKTFRQGWREFGGRRVYFRSRWEANYGRYLEWQKQQGLIVEWLHEPQTFWFEGIRRGCVTYLPDFKVILLDGSHEWIEVKGFMDPKSKTKIARFKKYFPKEILRIVDSKWYKANSGKLSILIPDWEKG